MEERSHIPVHPPISNPLPSYWQNPPSPLNNTLGPLSNDHDHDQQPYDHAIIGSGISGAMIAYNLLFKNSTSPPPRVIMLEARDVCSGATGRNGGHTKAASYRTYLEHKRQYGTAEALKIARLEHNNIRATHRLARELGIECDSQPCHTVDVIYDRETFEQGKKAVEELRRDADEAERELGGMAWYRIYDPSSPSSTSPSETNTSGRGKEEPTPISAITQKFWVSPTNTNPSPLLHHQEAEEHVVGAIEYAAGRINAYAFTTALLTLCVQQKGLTIHTHTPVLSITPPTPPSLTYTLQTPHTTLRTTSLTLATNAYTPSLLPLLQSRIVPLRGQITAQRPPPRAAHPSVLPRTYSFIYRSGYEYMVARNDGGTGTQHVVIGGGLGRLADDGASEYGTVDDSILNADVSTYLKGVLGGYFGATAEGEGESYEVLREWTGIMGATADGLPFVGEVPGRRGMWVCAGFNGHGMVLCLKCAEGVVGMMRGGGEEGKRGMEWFPESFKVTRERVDGGAFRGRVDLGGLEARGGDLDT